MVTRQRNNFILALILTSFLFVFLSFSSILKFYFLDVGQGDAILMLTPNNKTMLVDAGDCDEFHDYGEDVYDFIVQLGIKKLDAVVITHPHKDHIGGMKYILSNIKVGKFYDPGFPYPSSTYAELLNIVDNEGIKYELAREGKRIELDPKVEILILYPPKNLIFDDPNNNGVVIRVKYGEVAVMLTGDIEKNAEYTILKMYRSKKNMLIANILKVAHHGSATSTTEEFLDNVIPEVAIISCGINNRFGHPHPVVVKRLKSYGVEIYRTDKDGTIEVIIDGKDYIINKLNTRNTIYSR